MVAATRLHWRSGAPDIPPSDDVKHAIAGPLQVAVVKLCLTSDGKVDSTKLGEVERRRTV